MPGGTRDSGLGRAWVGGNLIGRCQGGVIMHNHVGKERGKRLKLLAGGRTSRLGKGRDLVKGESTWKAETRICSLSSSKEARRRLPLPAFSMRRFGCGLSGCASLFFC